MKKIAYIVLLFCCTFTAKAQQNLVLNGSFELNNAASFWNDMDDNIEYANTVFYSNSFGDDFTTSILKIPFFACSPAVLWGGGKRRGLGIRSYWSR